MFFIYGDHHYIPAKLIHHSIRKAANAAISSGNSGGPLVNEYGEIIGINTMHIQDSQNLNFAIFASELNNLSYDSPMTMPELYEKECNPISKLINYAIENGAYDYENNDYTAIFSIKYTDDGASIYSYLVYDVDNNEIDIQIMVGEICLLYLTIDEIDGYYTWGYIDDSGYIMLGNVTAATYTDNTLLGYYYNNISYSALRENIRELSSAMLRFVLNELTLSDIGVTAVDLGFGKSADDQASLIGSTVIIYNATSNSYLTDSQSWYTTVLNVTKYTLESSSSQSNAVKLTIISDGTAIAFKTEDGKYLYCDGFSLHFVSTQSENTRFVLEETDGGYYIRCYSATYDGVTPEYIDIYNGRFSCYSMQSDAAWQYVFQLKVVP